MPAGTSSSPWCWRKLESHHPRGLSPGRGARSEGGRPEDGWCGPALVSLCHPGPGPPSCLVTALFGLSGDHRNSKEGWGDTGLRPGPMRCSVLLPPTRSPHLAVTASFTSCLGLRFQLQAASSQTRIGNCSSRSPDPFCPNTLGPGAALWIRNQNVAADFQELRGSQLLSGGRNSPPLGRTALPHAAVSGVVTLQHLGFVALQGVKSHARR